MNNVHDSGERYFFNIPGGKALLKWHTKFGHLNRGDMLTSKHHRLSDEKIKMQALGAAMRKLIQICFGVIKNKTRYQSELALN